MNYAKFKNDYYHRFDTLYVLPQVFSSPPPAEIIDAKLMF